MNNRTHDLSGRRLAFIGGGNMASSIIGGLIKQGVPAASIDVVEPFEGQRSKLMQDFGLTASAAPGDFLRHADVVVWAVKPQTFKEAAAACLPHLGASLHLSVAAGIRSSSMSDWLGTQRVVRAMPNTPALVGRGMTGLFARDGADDSDRRLVEAAIAPTGQMVWLDQESDLDAVTALSGSGPAYVFYLLEAMRQAGVDMGLKADTATQLALATVSGAAFLAQESSDPPEVLRERVTSKGGTTYAALTSMEASGVKAGVVKGILAACQRAQELGDEFGA